jgi:hypothetical protein
METKVNAVLPCPRMKLRAPNRTKMKTKTRMISRSIPVQNLMRMAHPKRMRKKTDITRYMINPRHGRSMCGGPVLNDFDNPYRILLKNIFKPTTDKAEISTF